MTSESGTGVIDIERAAFRRSDRRPRNGFPRRVLITTDTVGGVWTFTRELSAELARHGVEVILASLGRYPSPAQTEEANRIPGLRLIPSNFKLEWMEDPWADVERSGQWLLELEAQHAPDLIHLNTLAHGALSWRAPAVLTAHSCVASWWKAVKREELPSSWNQYRRLVSQSVHSADFFAAPSRAMLDSLQVDYALPVKSPRCSVIYNGRSPRPFYSFEKEGLILSAGRIWDAAKNVAALADAARELRWPVAIAGEAMSPDGNSVQFPECRMLGVLSQADLNRYYARASVYALPARYEPFGFTALEAALSGCALVLGDIPSMREIWREAAIFVPPDDLRTLTAVLEKLMSNPALRRDFASMAQQRAREYSAERMATSYLNLYRQAVQERIPCAS